MPINPLAASVMLAAAANFNHVRFLGVLAVFTTVLAAFFVGTITCWVSALVVCFFGHSSRSLLFENHPLFRRVIPLMPQRQLAMVIVFSNNTVRQPGTPQVIIGRDLSRTVAFYCEAKRTINL